MNTSRRYLSLLVAAWAAACMVASGGAMAQATAAKTTTLIVPFPPGGATDAVARTMGPLLAKSLNQTVVVENITGASGSLAASKLFTTNDGSSIMLVSPSETIMPPLLNKAIKFKSEDFRLLIQGPGVPLALLMRPGLDFKSIDDLLAYARNPANKPLSYGSFGQGSIAHLAAEHFADLTGIQMIHIPYRGGAPVTQDLIGNQVDLSFFPLAGGAIQLVETGKIKTLGLAFDKALPQYAKFPLLTTHAQLKPFVHVAWQSLAIPKTVPMAVAESLNATLNTIFQSPEMREFAAKNGSVIPEPAGLAQIESTYNNEITRTRALAKTIDLQAQ